jgi:hypothetical protein
MPADAFVAQDEDPLEDRDQDPGFKPPLDRPTPNPRSYQLPVRHRSVLSLR